MDKKKKLTELFISWSGEAINYFSNLLPSGSAREYYRITSNNNSAVGVFNTDKKFIMRIWTITFI